MPTLFCQSYPFGKFLNSHFAGKLLPFLVFYFLGIQNSLGQLNASFFPDKQGDCKPAIIQFTNTTTGASANAQYRWDFGNGNSSVLQDAAATYDTEKEYTVTLTVTDGGVSSTASAVVTVYQKPTVNFTVNKTKICLPEQSIFTSSSTAGSGEIERLVWDFGDGSTGTGFGQNEINYGYENAQWASVTLTAINSFGCQQTLQKNDFIQILPALTSEIKSDKNFVCKTFDQVKFSTTSTGPGTLSYRWDFGDGNTSTTKNPNYVFNKSGGFNVKLRLTSSEGCSITTEPLVINVENFVSRFESPALLCEGNFVAIQNVSRPTPDFTEWTIGNGNNGITYNQQPFFLSLNPTGPLSIKMVNHFGTCIQTLDSAILIQPKPSSQPFLLELAGKCGAPDTIRLRDTTQLTTRWSWTQNFNSNPFSTVSAVNLLISNNGTYFINLRRTNAQGCTQEVNQRVQVLPPGAFIQIIKSSSPDFNQSCGPFTATFGATGTDSITAYNWLFPNGVTSTLAKPEHNFSNTGNNAISLNYTLANGCKGTANFNVAVYSQPKADFTYRNGQEICGFSPANIQPLITGASSRVRWDFDYKGFPGSILYPFNSNIYRKEGLYTVAMIVENGTCRDTMIKKDFYKVLPPFPKIARVENTCAGTRGTVTFSHETVGGITGIWNFGDGATAPFNPVLTTVQHTYSRSGNFPVSLTVTNGSCTLRDSTNIPVYLKQKPVLSFDRKDACSNENFRFDITNMEPHPVNWSSSNRFNINSAQYGDGTALRGVIFIPFSNNPWISTANGLVNSSDNESNDLRVIFTSVYFNCSDTTNYSPIAFKGARAGFVVVTQNRCWKTPVVFRDTSAATGTSNIVSRRWNFGDGQTRTTTTGGLIEHRYNNPGNYQVSLEVTDAAGCTVRTKTTANVRVSGPKVSFGMSGSLVPLNETIFFYNYSDQGSDFNTKFYWDFGDGKIDSSYSPEHTYPNAGNYIIRLIGINATTGCRDTASLPLVVRPFNTAFQIQQSFITTSNCPPILAQFINTSFGAERVEWDFGDGTTSKSFNASKIYHLPGKYLVRLKVFGFNGLVGNFLDSVIVKFPAASFSANPLFGCTGQDIDLTATPANYLNYLWDFGDGQVQSFTENKVKYAYPTAGMYIPRLLASDSNGCIAVANTPDKITIDSLGLEFPDFSPSICDSAMLDLKPRVFSVGLATNPTQYIYEWRITHNNKEEIFKKQDITYHFNKPGKYVLHFRVQSPFGCDKTITDSLVVVQGVKAKITAPANACIATPVRISGSTTQPAAGITWKWQLGNNVTSSIQNPVSLSYPQAGNITLVLIAAVGNCADTATQTLTIQPNPLLLLTPAANAVSCLGKGVLLQVNGASQYSWSPAAGLSATNIYNPTANPSGNTVYWVTGTSAFGCNSSDSVRVRVALPISVKLIPLDGDICAGNAINFTATGASGYQWLIPAVGLSATNIANPVATPQQTTRYTVVGRDADGCFTDTASTTVTVHPLPTVDAGPDQEIGAGTSVTLSPRTSANVSGYTWTPAAGLSCTNCATPVAKPNKPTQYIIRVKTDKGCEASDSINIKILCGDNFYIPTGFSPNADNLNDRFYVMGGGAAIRHFRIFNRWGTLLFERKNTEVNDPLQGWDGRFEGKPQPAGAYIYSVVVTCFDGRLFEYKGTITLIR